MQQIRVTGGFNPFDFAYKLLPGEELETPVFYGGYSHQGIGGASRLLHRFELTKIVPQAPNRRPRPVLYNSWEATGFDVNEAGQEALAEKAAVDWRGALRDGRRLVRRSARTIMRDWATGM